MYGETDSSSAWVGYDTEDYDAGDMELITLTDESLVGTPLGQGRRQGQLLQDAEHCQKQVLPRERRGQSQQLSSDGAAREGTTSLEGHAGGHELLMPWPTVTYIHSLVMQPPRWTVAITITPAQRRSSGI